MISRYFSRRDAASDIIAANHPGPSPILSPRSGERGETFVPSFARLNQKTIDKPRPRLLIQFPAQLGEKLLA